MDLINLKSVGIDPVKIETIQENALSITTDAKWIMAALRSIVSQIAVKFKLDLPPQS